MMTFSLLPRRAKRLFSTTAIALSLSCMAFGLSPLSAQEQQILNFRDADIRAMIDDISMMTGKTFILDPRVKGKITIISREPVPTAEVFDLFLSSLRVYGFSAVPTRNGAYKIVPDEAAVTDTTAPSTDAPDDILITEVFRLFHVDAITALNTVKPVIHRQGRAIAHRSNNFLVVVDYAGNMARIRSLIKEIDKDPSITRLITLRNTSAEEMADTVRALRGVGSRGEQGDDASLSIVPVISSNTLILKGSQDVVDSLMPIIDDLDQRNASEGDIRVIYLKYADAEQLLPVLEQVTRSLATLGGPAAAAGANGQAPLTPLGGARQGGNTNIAVHSGTNALIISGSPEMQKGLEQVIRKLDIPRTQVLIEAIIVEISDQAAKELGVQYVLSGGEGSNIPFTATNFTATAPNVLAATGALLIDSNSPFAGSAGAVADAAVNSFLGLNGFTGGFAGESNGTIFGVILNALKQDITSNILSTPFVTTLDNEPANLLVGQEIPVTSGEALGANNATPFRTVTRQEVGIQLEVTPQISGNGEIRMQINQEVSSIQDAIVTTSTDFITSKRNINTNVMAKDGEIIVLGGLIEQNESITLNKVPLLGDIPLLGNLFKSEAKSLTKTNLMVFIRPTIIKDGEDARAVTERKYNIARQEQLSRAPEGSEAAIDTILRDVIGRDPRKNNQ